MPVSIIKNAMKYKNPATGEYESFNAIQNDTTASQIAQIEEAGATAVQEITELSEEIQQEFDTGIATAVENWLDEHPEATTTVADGSITKEKLDVELQATVDDVSSLGTSVDSLSTGLQETNDDVSALENTVGAMSAARKYPYTSRYYIDGTNGNDNNAGTNAAPWKTLNKFFSMVNSLNGGSADIRCYIKTAGTYTVGAATDTINAYTGVTIHITGGTNNNASYDGNYIIRFLSQNPPKFYNSHLNLINVRIECPNVEEISIDGGNFSISQCLISAKLAIYTAIGRIENTKVRHIVVSGGSVFASNVTTTLKTDYQWSLSNNANVMYAGSISNNGLIANSTYAAFYVSASSLHMLQNYDTTLGSSLAASNAFLYCTSSRKTSWQLKAASDSNNVWITG